MANNKIIYLISALVVIALIGGGAYWVMHNQKTPASNPSSTTSKNAANQGRVVFSISDASEDIQNISSVQMTVSHIQLYSATQGWVTVSNTPKEFDLLQLKSSNKIALDADSMVPAGDYSQIRLQLDKVVAVKSGTAIQAALPSPEIQINGNVKVASNATASVALDFIANESLHAADSGAFIFAPVVAMQARSDSTVRIASDGSVAITGGALDTLVNVGMDLQGTMETNFALNSVSGIKISNGAIQSNTNSSVNANTTVNIQSTTNLQVGSGSICLSDSDCGSGEKCFECHGQVPASFVPVKRCYTDQEITTMQNQCAVM